MPNPRGINQYSKGGGRKPPKSGGGVSDRGSTPKNKIGTSAQKKTYKLGGSAADLKSVNVKRNKLGLKPLKKFQG